MFASDMGFKVSLELGFVGAMGADELWVFAAFVFFVRPESAVVPVRLFTVIAAETARFAPS